MKKLGSIYNGKTDTLIHVFQDTYNPKNFGQSRNRKADTIGIGGSLMLLIGIVIQVVNLLMFTIVETLATVNGQEQRDHTLKMLELLTSKQLFNDRGFNGYFNYCRYTGVLCGKRNS